MTDPEQIISPEPQPAKRTFDFSEEIFDEICDRMSNGKGLREICEDPDMPSRQTFLRWMEKDTGRQAKYQQAREALMDWYSEEILTIAWDDSKDTVKDKAGEPKCNHEWINRSRLKVDTLKFLMAKLHPKRYGDKPIEPAANDPALLSDAELDSKINGLQVSWNKIELVGVSANVEPLKARIKELEEELGIRERDKEPKLLTYNPGPLPASVDPVILGRVVSLIRDCVPQADNRPADEVLAEVESVCRKALAGFYSHAG